MSIRITIKILCLFVAIWFSIINFGKTAYKEKISVLNLIIQAIAITGFVVIQWNLDD